jgi:hypothetical protein
VGAIASLIVFVGLSLLFPSKRESLELPPEN